MKDLCLLKVYEDMSYRIAEQILGGRFLKIYRKKAGAGKGRGPY